MILIILDDNWKDLVENLGRNIRGKKNKFWMDKQMGFQR